MSATSTEVDPLSETYQEHVRYLGDLQKRVKALKGLGARMTKRPRKLAGEARAAIQSATDHFWVRRGALEVTREMKPKQRLEVEMAVMRVLDSIK